MELDNNGKWICFLLPLLLFWMHPALFILGILVALYFSKSVEEKNPKLHEEIKHEVKGGIVMTLFLFTMIWILAIGISLLPGLMTNRGSSLYPSSDRTWGSPIVPGN